ncbi:MAG: nucleoside recognition domain-containing protein [Bacillota bacterium]|jgi:spore maturation protein SpmB|nr:nucleoside recognition domain-containing protein [Bacillota bacterium]NLJ01949.1 hypothetical protein [Bacillota bacterium]
MSVLWDGFLQGAKGVWTIAIIVIPLMIVLEIAQSNGLLHRLNRFMTKPFKILGLSEEGAFPLVVAIVFGITYGSGVILNHARTGKVTPKEARVVGTFMAVAHALIEDTIIFWVLGVPLLLLLVPRIVLAYVMAYIVHRATPEELTAGE